MLYSFSRELILCIYVTLDPITGTKLNFKGIWCTLRRLLIVSNKHRRLLRQVSLSIFCSWVCYHGDRKYRLLMNLFDSTLECLVGSFPPILSCNRALVTCNNHKLSRWLLSLSWQLDPPCYTVSHQSPLCSSSNNNKQHCIASSAWAPVAAAVASTCFMENLALDLTHWLAVCFLISAVAVQWSKTPAMHYPTKDAEATTQEDKVETAQKLFTWRDQRRKGIRESIRRCEG